MSSSNTKPGARSPDGELRELIALSREFGSSDYVIGGGGNTSMKVGGELWVKKSGTSLSGADESTFIPLDQKMLDRVLEAEYPHDSDEREDLVKRGLLRSMIRPDLGGRPTVEASLHNLIPCRFVVHSHPWIVNALTCSKDGMDVLAHIFAGRAVAVPYTDPGYTLAVRLERELNRFESQNGDPARIIFLQNHGLIVAGESVSAVRKLMKEVLAEAGKHATSLPRESASKRKARPSDTVTAAVVNVIRSTLSTDARKTTALLQNSLTDEFCTDGAAFKAVALPFTPDQIVYCRSHPLWVPAPSNGKRTTGGDNQATGGYDAALTQNYLKALESYRKKHGVDPYVVCVQGLGTIAVGNSAREAQTIAAVFEDALKIAHASEKSGGPRPMTAKARAFIESWEVEKYRRSVSTAGARGTGASPGSAAANGARVGGTRTAVVTGGAQGFGEGIVRSLFADGFNVVIADLNEERGEALAAELRDGGAPPNNTLFVRSNVAEEESVSALLTRTLLEFGGCDLFVSNAGVLKAGGLDEINSNDFDFMTNVNYKGYFICTKYASAVMKRQHEHAPHLMSDILQINSKSGLEGSNKNFTYAGGKFGGIGLTQSFALELMPHGIKVNSICPGNFLDGPLWSDPKKGLFVQYLKAGKVPGAKTTDDVRRAYEAKVPAGRGCTVSDVMRAIYYVMEQEYETGQAVPVTGGQVMLK